MTLGILDRRVFCSLFAQEDGRWVTINGNPVFIENKFEVEPRSVRLEGHNYQRFVVYMSPDDFLAVAHEQVRQQSKEQGMKTPKDKFDFPRSASSLKNLEERISNRQSIDAPVLIIRGDADYDTRGHPPYPVKIGKVEVDSHEGRHRSLAAINKNVKEIPVVVEVEGLKNWHEYQRIRKDDSSMGAVMKSINVKNYRLSKENKVQ